MRKQFPHQLSPCFALAAAVLQRPRPDGGDVPWRGAYGKCGAHKCVKAIVPKSSERVEGMFADEAILDSVEGSCCCGIDVRQIASGHKWWRSVSKVHEVVNDVRHDGLQ